MSEILAIIPARGGSKGIPGKNLTLLAGKPLIWYTIQAAQKAKLISKIVVSTDDQKIKEYACSLGVEVIDRPPELASETAIVVDALDHVLEQLKKNDQYTPDIIVNLNPTSPMRSEKTIDKALMMLLDTEYDSVFTGFLGGVTYGYWQLNEDLSIQSYYNHLKGRRRQDLSKTITLVENGALYAIRTSVFQEVHAYIGKNPTFCLMQHEESVDINYPQDLTRAEMFYFEFYQDRFEK
jgi:CMP-N-acetylneuraminic acid synthetase